MSAAMWAPSRSKRRDFAGISACAGGESQPSDCIATLSITPENSSRGTPGQRKLAARAGCALGIEHLEQLDPPGRAAMAARQSDPQTCFPGAALTLRLRRAARCGTATERLG